MSLHLDWEDCTLCTDCTLLRNHSMSIKLLTVNNLDISNFVRSKVRLTLSEFKEFTKFTSELKEKKIMDADFVFQKLFIGKAFLFCVCSAPNKVQYNGEM
jgi:hypothetical protein